MLSFYYQNPSWYYFLFNFCISRRDSFFNGCIFLCSFFHRNKNLKKPADQKHPYGYYKFEVLAGVIITLILLITGFLILKESLENFLNPSKIEMSCLALLVMAISAIVNAIISEIKINVGKKENSISLISYGIHSRIDVLTSLAVFTGLFLSSYWIYIDPLLAFLIGLYIIKESFSLGKEAIDSLLDVFAPREVEEKIKTIAKNLGINLENLKTQRKGSAYTTDLEISLSKNLKVEEATKISAAKIIIKITKK